MPIYTRRGDEGLTSLADGSRVAKSSARVEAYGSVDEANCAIGVARTAVDDPLLCTVLDFIQQRLLNCAGSLASPNADESAGRSDIDSADVAFLERMIDTMESETGALRTFVIQGGGEAAARLFLAASITRRAERRIVALLPDEEVAGNLLAFVNRASDVLFASARYANKIDGIAEVPWDQTTAPPAV